MARSMHREDLYFDGDYRVIVRTNVPIEICSDEPVIMFRAVAIGYDLCQPRLIATERQLTPEETAGILAWIVARPPLGESELLEAEEIT